MRAQQKAIIETLQGSGGLRVDAEFLTFAEVIECVRAIAGHLGGFPQKLNRNTVQAWLKAGYVRPDDKERQRRNRLFSLLDVVRLAALFYVTQVGLSIGVARIVADSITETLQEQFGEIWTEFTPTVEFKVREFVYAVVKDGGWMACRPLPGADDEGLLRDFSYYAKRNGLVVLLNANLLCGFTFSVVGEKWGAKATALLDNMRSELRQAE